MGEARHRSRVAIVGCGAVGASLLRIFPDAIRYDEPRGLGTRDEVNACDFAFVAVPTPMRLDGSCDTSIVEEVCDWIEGPLIVLRSTVPPGTTQRLVLRTGKRVVFQPEYGPGETPDHHFADLRRVGWVILGGRREDTVAVADLYKEAFNADLVLQQTDSTTAELTKYMENCFLAAKVTFCNEFYSVAEALGVDYNELRELWLLDPRVGRSHTFVYPAQRGWGGACLPKDIAAFAAAARAAGAPALLMEAVQEVNRRQREQPAALIEEAGEATG